MINWEESKCPWRFATCPQFYARTSVHWWRWPSCTRLTHLTHVREIKGKKERKSNSANMAETEHVCCSEFPVMPPRDTQPSSLPSSKCNHLSFHQLISWVFSDRKWEVEYLKHYTLCFMVLCCRRVQWQAILSCFFHVEKYASTAKLFFFVIYWIMWIAYSTGKALSYSDLFLINML